MADGTWQTDEQVQPQRHWPSWLTWPVLLTVGWLVYEMTAQPMLGVVAVCAARGAYAQEPQQPMTQATQDDHLTEAVKQTQAAIEAGHTGQANLVIEHAQEALTHAQAAERERPSPNLEAAIKNLKEAVRQSKSGKVDVAMKAAQAALQKLQA